MFRAKSNLVVAFDMDGTLLDLPVDLEATRSSVAQMFAEHDYHEPLLPLLDGIDRAATTVANTYYEALRLIGAGRRIIDEAEVQAAAKAQARPGAIECVQSLKERDIPLGIVTNNSTACVEPALRAVGFDVADFVVSTRDDVRRPKPAPDGLIRLVTLLDQGRGTLWFLGDSPIDVSSAVAANHQVPPKVRALAIVGPHSTKEQLQAAGPCTIATSLSAAMEIING